MTRYIVDTKAQHPDVKEANLHAGLVRWPVERAPAAQPAGLPPWGRADASR